MRRLHSVESLIRNAGLLEYYVGEMARTDVRIDRKFLSADWAVPDFVIALSGPVVSAVMTLENRLDARRVAGHYAALGS